MPYIKLERRECLARQGVSARPQNAGELNYLITKLVVDYLARRGVKYQHFNDCIGVLEGAKLELYRRMVGPYEDTKITENGDVYP